MLMDPVAATVATADAVAAVTAIRFAPSFEIATGAVGAVAVDILPTPYQDSVVGTELVFGFRSRSSICDRECVIPQVTVVGAE